MENREFFAFGLTGGSASGKSLVARRFRLRGVVVIDADELAREVVAPGTEGLREIVAAFGVSVLMADGSLDRKRLACSVIQDPSLRERLEAITHPRLSAAGAERAHRAKARGEPF